MISYVLVSPLSVLAQSTSPSAKAVVKTAQVASPTAEPSEELEEVLVDPLLEDEALVEVEPTPIVQIQTVSSIDPDLQNAALLTINTLWGTVASFLSLVIAGLILKLVQLKNKLDE